MSTIYYAVFHCMANNCANMLVGSAGAASRSEAAWIQVYRALNHGSAKRRCQNTKLMNKFPPEIQDLASLFVDLQIDRHNADYAPDSASGIFSKSDVQVYASIAETIINNFSSASVKDRRAFAVYVLFDRRE